MKQSDIWFRFFKSPFAGSEPRYFEVQDEPWAIEIEKNYSAIREEVLQFIEKDVSLLKDYRFHITDGKPQWQTFSLMSWGFIHGKRIGKLPVTWNIFKNLNCISSVSVSRLIAGQSIPAHHGDTNAIYRCHLGIKIPARAPDCCFIAEDEERRWEEGKILAFCDARKHYARNLTGEDRYVILFDVIRPEFLNQKISVCADIIATHVLHAVDMRLNFYEAAPVWLLKFLVTAISVPAYLFLRVQHLFYKI